MSARDLRILAPVFALALALAGCGFRPLYGNRAVDPDVDRQLASIHVVSLSDRSGQLLRNALLPRLNPGGEPLDPRYELQVILKTSEAQVALQTDQTATRDEVTYAVSYVLYRDKVALTKGSFTDILSYDYLPQHYANVVAAQDVERRASEEIADELRNRMAAYFARAEQARERAAQSSPAAPAAPSAAAEREESQ